MNANRDILVMFGQDMLSEEEISQQVIQLNKLLFYAERPENFSRAHEVMDMNRYKKITRVIEIKKMLRSGRLLKPFIFLSNKN